MSKGIMITCKDATEMVVKKNQEKLSFSDWMKLQMHLLLCNLCRRFAIQNKFIDNAIRKLDAQHHHDLSSDFKERVLHELEK